MRLLLTFISTLVISLSFGQNFSYPAVSETGQTTRDFVPAGWTILDSATGDLNKDKLNDAIIVLQHTGSLLLIKPGEAMEDTVLMQPRMLVILFRNPKDNNFYLVEQNNSFILNHDDPSMDDPYQGINIYKGIFQINFHRFYNMGSWYTTKTHYKFRYQNTRFILIGASYFTIHRSTLDFEDYSYNFLTKKRSLIKGNDNNRIKKTYWKPIKIDALRTLKIFKEPYSWEVETDIYL